MALMWLSFVLVITHQLFASSREYGGIILSNDKYLYEADCPNNGTWCNCKQGSCFTNWDGEKHCNYGGLYQNNDIVVHMQAVLTGGQ